MKQEPGESSGLLWALAFMALILVSIGSVYIWKKQPASKSKLPAPVFVDVGEVRAHAENKRLIVANVVLEVAGKKTEAKVTERLTRVRTAVTNGFAEFSDQRLTTTEGKQALQQQIRDELNELFGKRAVREVLFTNFVFSVY